MLKVAFLSKSSSGTRNTITLITGTTIAQAIPIAVSPILTRLFTPDDFGKMAIYISLTTLLTVIATGRYEHAIILPKSDSDAINIMVLAMVVAAIISGLLLLLITIFHDSIVNAIPGKNPVTLIYFAPLTILITGVMQSLNYWFIRKGKFKAISIRNVSVSLVNGSSKICFGYSKLGVLGLLFGNLLGTVVGVYALSKDIIKDKDKIIHKITGASLKEQAKRYIDFPKFLVVAHLLNNFSRQLPVIFLSVYFNNIVVGFFSLAQNVISQPASVIAVSIGDVFREQASKEYILNGNCETIFLQSAKKLLLISILPFSILFCFAPNLFQLVFGESWQESGKYVRVLITMFFLQFVVAPLNCMFMIAEKQKYDLMWQVGLFIISLLALVIGKFMIGSVYGTLFLFSSGYSLMYVVSFFMSWNFSKGRCKSYN